MQPETDVHRIDHDTARWQGHILTWWHAQWASRIYGWWTTLQGPNPQLSAWVPGKHRPLYISDTHRDALIVSKITHETCMYKGPSDYPPTQNKKQTQGAYSERNYHHLPGETVVVLPPSPRGDGGLNMYVTIIFNIRVLWWLAKAMRTERKGNANLDRFSKSMYSDVEYNRNIHIKTTVSPGRWW